MTVTDFPKNASFAASVAEASKDVGKIALLDQPRKVIVPNIYNTILTDQIVVKAPRKKEKGELPVVGCMPGCTKDHPHDYDYDYTKNHKDSLN